MSRTKYKSMDELRALAENLGAMAEELFESLPEGEDTGPKRMASLLTDKAYDLAAYIQVTDTMSRQERYLASMESKHEN